ncbi:hypothetical protein ACT7C6_11880 [Bacillus paranthracis]
MQVAFLSAGKGLINAFVDGIKNTIGKAVSAVQDGMNAVRQYLPFSPAKKGPLSDLDKSGEAFFPTWYEGALTQVKPMTRAIGKAMGTMNDQLQGDFGGVALEAFSGGTAELRVKHEHTINLEGEVGFDAKGVEDLADQINAKVQQTVVENGTGGNDYMKDLKQAFRRK